jgi:transcriptional regulator with XRE-family HTH domain
MKNRILEFLKVENKSSAQFAEEIGVQPSGISHIISGRNNPSLDFVMKMLKKYPALSTDWLIFGKGQMYREKQLYDLFDAIADDETDSVNHLSENKPEDNIRLQNSRTAGESVGTNERNTLSGSIKTKRVICFFNDDTFKEYFPGNE